MVEIQSNIINQGKQNAISQRFDEKHDNEAIASWKLDLDRITRDFNVRSITSVLSPLTLLFQTEFETHVTESEVHHAVVATHAIVSHVDHDNSDANNIVLDSSDGVSNAHVASDIHLDTLKIRGDADGQNPAVSTSCTLAVTEQSLTAAQTRARSAIGTINESWV